MKKFILPIAALCAVLWFSSCSEDFKIAAPYKAYTIVYGILDMNDTAHYIRIQKSFLAENLNAYDMAKVSDSNFFPVDQITVEMREISSTGAVTTLPPLTRVDLNTEGYQKQAGQFFTGPNWAYKFKTALNPLSSYRMVITNSVTGVVDSAETYIINDHDNTSFFVNLFDYTAIANAGIDFSRTDPNSTFTLDGNYYPSGSQAQSPVKMFEATMRFRWIDSNKSNAVTDTMHADFNLGQFVFVNPSDQGFEFKINNTTIYHFLSENMGQAPSGIVRVMDSCDIFIYAASKDYYDYEQAALVLGSGLTGDEIQPIFTDVKGKDVLGLYANRGMRHGRVTISNTTADSMEVSSQGGNGGLLNGLQIVDFRH